MIYHGYTVDTAYVQDGGLKWVTTGCGYYITATKGGSRYFIKRNTVYRRPLPGEKCAALAKKNREGAAFIEGKQTEIARRMKKFTLADGIVRELDHFWDDDTNTYVTVTEYISGELAPSAVPAGERAALIAQIANSLAALHDAGVGHFDIKVKNIVIRKTTGGYQGVFVDFDNSYPDNELPEGDKIPFTPGYEAPEVVLHESGLAGADDRITLAKDVFSLGIVFHELLVGKMPSYSGPKGIESVGEALASDGKALLDSSLDTVVLNPGNGQTAKDLIAAMIARKPADRPTMRTVAAALNATSPGVAVAPRVIRIDGALGEADSRIATLNVADVKAKCECFYFKDGKYIVRMKGASADESLTLDELVAKGLATHKQVLSGSFPTDKGIELLSDAELRAKGVVSIEVLPDGGRSPFYVLTHYSGGRMSAEGLVRQGYAKRVTATAAPDGRLRPEDACKWRINDAELKRRGIISVKQVENGGRLMYEITQSDGKTYLRNIMQMALTYLVIAS